jgi:hypothetical protein
MNTFKNLRFHKRIQRLPTFQYRLCSKNIFNTCITRKLLYKLYKSVFAHVQLQKLEKLF